MNKGMRALAIAVAVALALSGCTDRILDETGGASQSGEGASNAASSRSPDNTPAESGTGASLSPGGTQQEEGYIDKLVGETVSQIITPGMSEFDKAKAAFDYMIETATLIDPVGLDLWQIRGDYRHPPSFVENRSLSILLFQLGKCEDYAAALTMLLRGMGLEAQYVPGLTYSTQGALVDHAWTIVKVDGTWYHLDCQLEQNISRHGTIRYKYFMRGDATMSGSHRWGQNLINTGLLTPGQNEEIAQLYLMEACPQDYPTPDRRDFTLPDAPDVEAIQAAIEAEFQEYQQANGSLELLESNIIPPVFGLEGYGPQD